jgi:hypothetical protein
MKNPLSQLTVYDESGLAVPLHRTWRDSAVVLVFVRHFG